MRHMLDWWIYDYLNRRGLHQSAEAWFDELNHVVRPHVVSPSEGFLMDWWGFFWQHFNADGAPNTESSLQLTPNMINPVPISRADVVSESNVNPFPAPTSGFDEHGVLGHIHVSGVHVPPWPALNPGIMGSNNVLGNVGLPGVGVCPHVYGVIPVMNINTGLASQFNPNNISNSTPVLGLPLVPRSNIASELNMQSSGMQGQQHMGIPIGYSNIQLNLEENVFMQDPYRSYRRTNGYNNMRSFPVIMEGDSAIRQRVPIANELVHHAPQPMSYNVELENVSVFTCNFIFFASFFVCVDRKVLVLNTRI